MAADTTRNETVLTKAGMITALDHITNFLDGCGLDTAAQSVRNSQCEVLAKGETLPASFLEQLYGLEAGLARLKADLEVGAEGKHASLEAARCRIRSNADGASTKQKRDHAKLDRLIDDWMATDLSNTDLKPLVSSYSLTCGVSALASVRRSMRNWNLPRLDSCCHFHTGVRFAKRIVSRLESCPCEPLWSPSTGWQCGPCSALNRQESLRCCVCDASVLQKNRASEPSANHRRAGAGAGDDSSEIDSEDSLSSPQQGGLSEKALNKTIMAL